MSSDKFCCVPGCKEIEGVHKVLHRFPNPEDERERLRFNSWLYAVGGDILGLENERIYKYRRVCRAHFEDKYHCRNNRLSNAAVPTLNLPGFREQMISHTIPERKPMQQIQNIEIPSTSRDPDSYLPLSSCKNVYIKSKCMQKENMAEQLPPTVSKSPETLMCEAVVSRVNKRAKLGSTTAKKNTRRLYLTKMEQDLHSQIVAAKIKICKLKSSLKKKLTEIKAAKKLATNPAVMKTIENLSSTAQLLLQIQWRENKKKVKGRRFTLQEKIVALSILKQSPRGYRFFRKIFILPAPQTLVKLVQKSNLSPGLNKNIFSQLKKKSETMTREEKICILLFDEISLKPHVTYGERKDKVTGFVDNGQHRKPDFADHAQVFMVRGLMKNYKQAVSYTFSASATKGPELAKQIKEVISEIQEAGLTVVATVCDQGSNNRQALKLLLNETKGIYLRRGEEPKDNIILINEKEIIPLYDPPHLLKGLRNNLLTKNLQYEIDGKISTAKWSHLKLLYKENPGYRGVKIIPKLTESHVNPEKLNKMKVKYASQIFSRTIASNMGYLAGKGILPSECQQTADLMLFVDNIFDSVNGSNKKNRYAKPLLGPATPTSPHSKTWSEGKKIFKTMKFITAAGREESVPTLTNWVLTLEGIEVLLKKLQNDYGITSLWLRHLNQDPLENFFGAVRSHGCRNVNPTCDQFESAFATLLINNLSSVHGRGKNCEDDLCDALHALIVHENIEEPPSTCTFDFDNIINLNLVPLEDKENDPRIIAPLQYMSGYFLKKAKTKIFKTCAQCATDLGNNEQIEYIQYREYAGRRWLCTPSKDLIKLVSNMQDIINVILKNNLERNNLIEIIKTAMIILIDFNFLKCNIHKQALIDFLIKIINRCLIFNYCKNINKIIAGRAEINDEEDKYQAKAIKHYKKCFKRKN